MALGLEISLPILGGLTIIAILAIFYYRKSKRSRSGMTFTMSKSRIVDSTSTSEIKVEPVELGGNPTGPAELDSANAPVLSASHENVGRFRTMPIPVPWDNGNPRRDHNAHPATRTVRSINPQGPLPLPVSSTLPQPAPRGSGPNAGAAITQADGSSTPPPIQELAGSALAPKQGSMESSSAEEALECNVSSDSGPSDGRMPSNGIIAPPNSVAPSSTLMNSSSPSTRSYDSNTKTVLDVGIVLHTARTESEHGDVSPPPLTDDAVEENELKQYLQVVGWDPRHKTATTVVRASEAVGSNVDGPEESDTAGSEGTGSEITGLEVGEYDVEKVRSALSEPVGKVGDSEDSWLGAPSTRGRSI